MDACLGCESGLQEPARDVRARVVESPLPLLFSFLPRATRRRGGASLKLAPLRTPLTQCGFNATF